MNITLLKQGKEVLHNLPEHWDEVPIKQYIAIQNILGESHKSLEKIVKIIRVLTDISERDIYRLPVNNINELGKHLSVLLNSEPDDELKHIVTIHGVDYGFHPKLVDLTFGEWVDIDALLSQGVNNNLHKILSILYRPVTLRDGDKYQIEPYEPSKEREQILLNNLTVGDFNGASVFFSDLGRELLNHTLQSSVKVMKKDLQERKEQFLESGVGIR